MPIYEYRCLKCGKRSSVLVMRLADRDNARCRHCDSKRMERLVSRVAFLRSEESRMDALSDPGVMSGFDENDPASMARWAKRVGKEFGEDVSDEVDAAMESGEFDDGGESYDDT